ncbi:restriction endonuclease subunit S [Polluticoccus soli]
MRFPGFEDEWEVKNLGEVCEIKTGSKDTQNKVDDGKYPFFVRSNTIEKINSYSYDGEAILTSGDGVGVGKIFHYINEKFDFHQRVYSLRKFQKCYSGKYIYYLFSDKFYDRAIRLSAKNSVDSVRMDMISGMRLYFPEFLEQQKIASFLSLIDDRITTQNKIIKGLKSFKTSLRNYLFGQVVDQRNDSFQIKEILEYEQPTKYLVSNTNYSADTFLTPVLTANKAFILGYTGEKFGIYEKGECIIFDDFTMDMKYVDFPFKVKSSAIKILTPKPNVNLRFVFEYLIFLNLQARGHKRHYISEIEPKTITLPNTNTQNSLAKILLTIDQKIEDESAILNLYTKQKQYLLQQMFI